ncbi:S8 family serine peptidase [Actinomycetospora lutea]|uniref:S8 family serine peptidase n=1 Tax=Actinomycetospora lutea TaxID=663604 RepID=UPI00236733DD|nr:S8 family serine peptidase [Actinomycetospora lutea]MDD7942428.1 S8 family serine peptidase [Actinomycetospora lutea]
MTAPMTNMTETLSIEIIIDSPTGSSAPTLLSTAARPHSDTVGDLRADPGQLDRAAAELARLGFRILATSRLSLSIEGSRGLFAETFGTEMTEYTVPTPESVFTRPSAMSFAAPAVGAAVEPPPSLAGLVAGAYVQPPFVYLSTVLPPRPMKHHLVVPGDVAALTNASTVHREGTTGNGVTVAMIDSGFWVDHPYYVAHGYTMSRILGPGASDLHRDEVGHGTAEAANILAVAPDVTFIGVKSGPSLAAAFKETVKLGPDVISVSLGFDLRDPGTGLPLSSLPNLHKALEAEIAQAVADGIVVVFSAGNGHIAFPGMHPDVISAGGVSVDASSDLQASDYASAFVSRIYPGRACPDVCGLVGMKPHADLILLPLEPGCDIDRDTAAHDGTVADDGWSVISGTSAAAPQLAGVVALLLQKNPGLSPAEVKTALRTAARDVVKGSANGISNPVRQNGRLTHVGLRAGQGRDSATGSGLVDALAAWKQV